MADDSSDEFATMVAHIARDLLGQRNVYETLNRITRLAVENIEGCDYAGVLLVRPGGRVETIATTSQLVRDSDHLQGELGEGPCFDAARQEQSYRVVDMRDEKRWPHYAPKARELGIGSMMGFQLFAEPDGLGALDLYSEQPYTFTPQTELRAWIFASHAGVALAGARHAEQVRTGG